MFGCELFELVRTDSGDQVLVHGHPVARQGVLSNAWRCDVLHPMGEPLSDGPTLPGPRYGPGVAELFELPDLADNVRLGLAPDMPPVRPAVVAYPNGYAPVPPSVAALVDARCAVRLTSHSHLPRT